MYKSIQTALLTTRGKIGGQVLFQLRLDGRTLKPGLGKQDDRFEKKIEGRYSPYGSLPVCTAGCVIKRQSLTLLKYP